jgi:hypothetical protein
LLEPLHVEPELSHEKVPSARVKPITPLERPSPEPEVPEEGFQPSDFPYFKDEFFEDFRNTSNYAYQRRPLVPVIPCDPLDKELFRESIKELTAIMSSE